jgi:predicted Zn-dependent peptidase
MLRLPEHFSLKHFFARLGVCVAVLSPPALAQPVEPVAPGPAGAVEIWAERGSGVTSAWLGNGVLVHHKLLKPEAAPADAAPDARRREVARIAVCVTLAGAELLETPENRGVSDAAVAASWNARSVRSISAEALRASLETAGILLRAYAGGDSFVLTASTSSGEIEPAMRAVQLLLSEPVVDAGELARWKERTIAALDERQQQGNDALEKVIAAMFGPQEARARRASREAIEALTPERAQAWLDTAVGVAPGSSAMPLEVAIVGDIPLAQAIEMAEKYFAHLPARTRIADTTLADRRAAVRADRPPEILTLPTWTGTPLVLVGFFGADIRDIADHRALTTAAKLLNDRLNRLPPEQQDADQSFAMAMPASVYPGFGLFLASTRAKEGNDIAAAENIRKLLDDLMTAGPSPEELSKASQELSDSAAKATSDPLYWARTLSRSSYHGFRISEIPRAPAAYRDMPADAIKAALRKYWTPERSIKLIVRPATDLPAQR